MIVSFASNAVKLVHLDYPDVSIAILDLTSKQVKLSMGIGLRTFTLHQFEENRQYVERYFGVDNARKIELVGQSLLSSHGVNRSHIQQIVGKDADAYVEPSEEELFRYDS